MMLRWIVSALFLFQIYVMMVVIGLLWAPWAYFSRDGAYHCCKSYSRWVFWTARWMVGIETEVRGRPPEGEVIVAAKHQSFLDVMMIFTALPRARFVMKQAILYTPVIGLYGKRLGCVPVVRGKGGSLAKMVQEVAAEYGDLGQLTIYPQGTRVEPGAEKPYKVGTYALYSETGQTVVPVAVNVGLFWPRQGILRKPGKAVVEFLDPIEPGLDQATFMAVLEDSIETRSNALMAEGGFSPKT